jgi:hypothetical protein
MKWSGETSLGLRGAEDRASWINGEMPCDVGSVKYRANLFRALVVVQLGVLLPLSPVLRVTPYGTLQLRTSLLTC